MKNWHTNAFLDFNFLGGELYVVSSIVPLNRVMRVVDLVFRGTWLESEGL